MGEYRFKSEDIDLELTLTCGQTFCWNRFEGGLYGEGSDRFYSFRNGEPLIAEEKDGVLVVETELSEKEVRKALDLETDLDKVFSEFPESEALERSVSELWGLRIISDEFFPCLVSYLCSPQMRIPRIKKMHNDIARQFGEEVEVDGKTVYRFPEPEELAEASEEALRELGVGYRAEYIVKSTEMIENGHYSHEELSEMNYEEAREHIKQLYGVGDKVADCVLLFSKGFHEAYPIDTWAQKCIKTHYPALHHDKYEKTSENVREHFGQKAGYAQEYLFHAARKDIIEVED
ncbi:MAG: 8-oxoguanine DNA glycosylase [Nanohaloarchaea archaeon SW_4_43_9]|nr:MAG: 8-oxoguanine DNA glycosylase [Nanohaloarchaea archaeon SW_4_43_9]